MMQPQQAQIAGFHTERTASLMGMEIMLSKKSTMATAPLRPAHRPCHK